MEASTSTNNVKAATPVTPVSDNGHAMRGVAATAATTAAPSLQTEFLSKVRENFIDATGKSLWPKPPADNSVTKQEIAAFELPNAVSALFDTLERGAIFPAGMPGTAIALIKKAVDATAWPNTADVPENWKNERKQFHEFEIGAVVNIMMKAFNLAGQHGTPHEWPPTNP